MLVAMPLYILWTILWWYNYLHCTITYIYSIFRKITSDQVFVFLDIIWNLEGEIMLFVQTSSQTMSNIVRCKYLFIHTSQPFKQCFILKISINESLHMFFKNTMSQLYNVKKLLILLNVKESSTQNQMHSKMKNCYNNWWKGEGKIHQFTCVYKYNELSTFSKVFLSIH